MLSYLPLCSRVFFFPVLFSIVITSLGEEIVGIHVFRTFVCLSSMR